MILTQCLPSGSDHTMLCHDHEGLMFHKHTAEKLSFREKKIGDAYTLGQGARKL